MSRKNIPMNKSLEGEEKIRRLLSYLGLKSKVALAEYLGKSAQAINSAQVRNSVPDTWIDRIAVKQGCSPSTLRKFVDIGLPMGQQKDYNNLISSDARLRELVDIWQALNPQQREIIQGFVTAVSRGDGLIRELLTHQVQVIAELLRYKQQDQSLKSSQQGAV